MHSLHTLLSIHAYVIELSSVDEVSSVDPVSQSASVTFSTASGADSGEQTLVDIKEADAQSTDNTNELVASISEECTGMFVNCIEPFDVFPSSCTYSKRVTS